MPPITRAVKKRRRGVERWRCGVCLFELAEYVRPLSCDSPYEDVFVPKPTSDNGYVQHEVEGSTFSSSAKRGCNVCRFLWQAWRDEGLDNETVFWDHGSVWLWTSARFQGGFHIFSQDASSPADLSSTHPFVSCGGLPSGDTRSPDAFQKAAEWFQRCCDGHPRCSKVSAGNFMPRRIVFIEDLASFKVRLLEDADKLPPQRYVCLSHRWMPETEAFSLTRERAETFRNGISKDLFHPLLIDALEATYRLGFRYLWIDCLCIYQDDLQDWHHEASEMSNIYENAALTISALSCDARSENKRLFSRVTLEKTEDFRTSCGKTISFRSFNALLHPFRIHPWTNTSFSEPSAHFPLVSRGWAYQERLLSNRIIHFTGRELMWECNEAFWCECRFRERLWERVKSCTASIADRYWTEIVREYTKTELSREDDRLPALSGIARRYNKSHIGAYLSGVWEKDIMAQLIWVMNGSWVTARPMPRKVPSWSWASVNGLVFFRHLRHGLTRFVSHEIVPGPNPFGVPEKAQLVLEGPCIPATLLHGRGLDNVIDPTFVREIGDTEVVLRFKDVYMHVRPDYSFTTPGENHIASGTQVLYMVLEGASYETYGWVLTVSDASAGAYKYERLGIGSSQSLYENFDNENFLEACSLKQIILI